MSAPRYEVRCRHGEVPFDNADAARAYAIASDFLPCAPHALVSIDPDGTETDITDESETTAAKHTCTPGLIGSAYGCPACGLGVRRG